jgi:ssDNA-binding replication factor A large subunit
MKKINVEGYITEKAEEREVVSRNDGLTYRVCNFLLSETKKATNETSITLVLWENDVVQFRLGDHVEIKNGYATEYNTVTQLNVGKYGTIKLLV